ncbi:hypothetical protein DCW30_15070 [Streptomyces alfalfae]|uniref:STAS domain-containing protein n=1 Tax=Streptomyces alfalfae TaxID=1642299 RepID=A0A1P8TBU5_9ACTN|nr:STAS domain-containing protein [Streptomyces alfalfae]AYA15433.1 hypothetical protein D3X13_03510 [Streptomyces fradiae]APY85094.1 hypothetical protein A7J05_04505 [Streptomyces alfalfae]QQC92604.1 hypothetical protein I8755_32645 [Streptomyces alfalfae]QUI35074.1 hypothetical protein H9W91_32730 [Streptomyces alfalfae]RXX43903.1 hypothetical protein DCW30_15070 [Streptomyces alfalfae]
MSLPNHPVDTDADAEPIVIPLAEIVDLANAERVRDDLRRLLRSAGTRVAIVDLRTPCLTAAAVGVLERTQALADRLGVRLLVVAPHRLTRHVLRVTAADVYLAVHPDLLSALREAAAD